MSDLREQKELIISENNKATQQLPAKIDMIESPDLEWQRFVESLSPEDKSKASGIFSESMIANPPQNPQAQIQAILRILNH